MRVQTAAANLGGDFAVRSPQHAIAGDVGGVDAAVRSLGVERAADGARLDRAVRGAQAGAAIHEIDIDAAVGAGNAVQVGLARNADGVARAGVAPVRAGGPRGAHGN